MSKELNPLARTAVATQSPRCTLKEFLRGATTIAARVRTGVLAVALAVLGAVASGIALTGADQGGDERWIGTWATAPQAPIPDSLQTFHNQTLRLIVHVSAGGKKARIKVSNTFGDHPLLIGGAHLARRASAADIDSTSDRALTFQGQRAITIPARSMVVSDPVALDVPALSDLAVSLFLPETAAATTSHVLALQTSYVSAESGDSTGVTTFPVARTTHEWPFLTGVDVAASPSGYAIVAFGSSLTDGDGSTRDANRRWPDVLAERLQKDAGRRADVGVLNEGIIGNRLLSDSPREAGLPFGDALGQAGLARFERDVLAQAGVKYVVVGLGINDIAFPGSLTPAAEGVSAESLMAGYRQLIARAHEKGIRVIGTTNPAFEDSFLVLSKAAPPVTFFTAEKEGVRQKVNDWIRSSGEFDAVVDMDQVVRDPSHPARLLPSYDRGDHLHPNDAGCRAEGSAIPLALFEGH